MSSKLIVGGIALVVVGLGLLLWQETTMDAKRKNEIASAAPAPQSEPASAPAPRMPAYYASAPDVKSLAPILPAEQFFGPAREGYEKAKEIPQLLAQLPCYCECDLHMGHKSLQSCFSSDHGANCSLCLSEALRAYDLQKKGGMSTAKIREQIIAEFSSQ